MASVTRTAVVPLQGGVGYELTTHEQWTPDAVTAAWDGTSAAGAFVVAVSFYNNGGALIDRAFPENVTNAPGDTGRTFFRPFKRGGGGAGGGGIVFDTPNVGGTLEIETTLAGGFVFTADTGGIDLHVLGVSNANLISDGGDAKVHAAGTATLESDDAVVVAATAGDLTMRSRDGITTVRGDTLVLRSDNDLLMPTLPVVDPGVSGALWNSGGFVAVSP